MTDSYPSAPDVRLPAADDAPAIRPGEVAKRFWEQLKEFWHEILGRISFWTFLGTAVALSSVYYYVFAESLYDSNSIIAVQNKSSVATGASSVLGGVLGTSAGGSQTEQLYDYIISLDMAKILDKKFHLRQLYSSSARNPFWRLWWPASDDQFLDFYQSMIEVVPDTTNSLITIDVLDYDAQRSQAMAQEIVSESQKFINTQSGIIQRQTMKYAEDELQNAVRAVQSAKFPYEQQIAELRLTAAQQALAAAAAIANQQQVFVMPVSVPNRPTDSTRPTRLLDIAGIALIAAMTYAVGFLMWSNARDHRR